MHGLLQGSKTYKLLLFLIPQIQKKRLEATADVKGPHGLHNGRFIEALLQPIVRNPGKNMVDMVQADIACEILKHFGELVI